MKCMVTVMIVGGLAAPAGAAECTLPRDLDAMTKGIETASTCRSAAVLASDCAFGASGDVSLNAAVIKVCEKDFLAKLDQRAVSRYRQYRAACAKKYARSQGTIYLSAEAFCEADVAARFSNRALHR